MNAPVPSSPPILCALVNNMPDAAFVRTERDFCRLVEDAAGPNAVTFARFTLPGVDRSPAVAAHVAQSYRPLHELWQSRPALVIMTGAHPRARVLEEEPFWPAMATTLDWLAGTNTCGLLSCLAAHAFLQHRYGIERTWLAAKRTGVFEHCVDESNPLGDGAGATVLLPHSRWNEVPGEVVRDAGHRIVLDSPEAGWAVAAGPAGEADVVLVQGHPEYGIGDLVLEYRRDALRFVRGQVAVQPALPKRCAARADYRLLEEVHARVLARGITEEELLGVPFHEMSRRAPWPWRQFAGTFFSNLARLVVLR